MSDTETPEPPETMGDLLDDDEADELDDDDEADGETTEAAQVEAPPSVPSTDTAELHRLVVGLRREVDDLHRQAQEDRTAIMYVLKVLARQGYKVAAKAHAEGYRNETTFLDSLYGKETPPK